jgi:hypothetical protein
MTSSNVSYGEGGKKGNFKKKKKKRKKKKSEKSNLCCGVGLDDCFDS